MLSRRRITKEAATSRQIRKAVTGIHRTIGRLPPIGGESRRALARPKGAEIVRSLKGATFALACLAAAMLPASPASAGPASCTIVAPATSCGGYGDCFPGGVLTVSAEVTGPGVVTGTATCVPDSVSCTALPALPCTAALPINAVWGSMLTCTATVRGLPTGWRVVCSI